LSLIFIIITPVSAILKTKNIFVPWTTKYFLWI
jgi:hypothetical protein